MNRPTDQIIRQFFPDRSDSHHLTSRIACRLEEILRNDVTIHVDPVGTRGERATNIKRGLDELVISRSRDGLLWRFSPEGAGGNLDTWSRSFG